MNYVFVIVGALLSYIVYGFYISQVDLTSTENQIEFKTLTTFYDYRGVMNVQSELSNGSGTPESIIQEANAAGLDFIILTDINTYPLPHQVEGYHGKLLALVGGIYSYLDSRLIYLNLNREHKFESPGSMQLHLTDLLSRSKRELQNELLILSRHIQQERATWSGAYPESFDGLEIINLKEMIDRSWKQSPVSFLWSFFALPFNPQYAFLRLFNPMEKETKLWDQLNRREHKYYGYLGNNSTAKAISIDNINLKFPSHQRSFSVASNHILLRSELTGNAQMDREKIFRALKNGQLYMSIDLLADPAGFTAYMSRRQNIYSIGSKVPLHDGLKLHVSLPTEPKYSYEIVALRDGERVKTSYKKELVFDITKPGTYRVIVRVIPSLPIPDGKKWINWIQTNPFFVE